MNLPRPIARIVNTGTAGTNDDQKLRIRIINSLSLTTALLATTTGILFYVMTGRPEILIPAMLESCGFALIIWLNKKKKHETAGVFMLSYQVVWATYFAVLLGPKVEIISAIIFMISASFLLYKKRSSIIICLAVSCSGLLFAEISYYTGLITPLPLDHDILSFIRWNCILFILVMNTMTILLNKKKNTELLGSLREQTEKLEKANLSRRTFLQETSHEIRNPLNAIFGIVQLMKMEEDDGEIPESMKPLIDNLYVASFNVKGIINNVLELSRIEAGQTDELHRKEMEIRSGIRNYAGIYEYVAGTKSSHIEVSFDEALPEFAYTDEIKLSQIISNLLTNAIRFTRHNSVIRVHSAIKGDQWYISVTDQGGGIEKEKLKHIFQPFVREKSTFIEGSGLGLYISKHFAELLNGDITVECEEGEGTTFTVFFPLSDTSGPRVAPPGENGTTVHFGNKTVLIIEDDKMSQVILRNFLKSLGLAVQTANNGVEGLAAARQQPPDLIILDSYMPQMNGRETLFHIRQDARLQHIPVIVASGDAFTETANGFLREGADEYVIKPVEFVALQHVLEKYLSTATQLTSS
jgi:signal transduction histidine kinase/CheY-like chemotaxis protein